MDDSYCSGPTGRLELRPLLMAGRAAVLPDRACRSGGDGAAASSSMSLLIKGIPEELPATCLRTLCGATFLLPLFTFCLAIVLEAAKSLRDVSIIASVPAFIKLSWRRVGRALHYYYIGYWYPPRLRCSRVESSEAPLVGCK